MGPKKEPSIKEEEIKPPSEGGKSEDGQKG